VGAAHRPVVSAPEEKVAYDARDPALQLWVAATIHDTAVRIVEAVWGPLPPALADELLERNGRLATVLGLPADEWPRTRAAFDAAFSAGSPLGFDEVSLPVVEALLHARAVPRWIRLVMPLYARATWSSLPGLGLERLLPRGVPDLLPLAKRLAPAWRLLPRSVRLLPARRFLAAARRAS
jgi:uncharacterized protein (DUF2236 family)